MRRRDLVRAAVPAAGLAVLAGCGKDADAPPAPQTGVFPRRVGEGDTGALAFLLVVEYLLDDFYGQVVDAGALQGAQHDDARAFGEQEQAHVEILIDALRRLGGTAPGRPRTRFPVQDPEAIPALASRLENAAAGAYLGQAGRIRDPRARATLMSILSVEARHAAAFDVRLGRGVSRAPVAKPWTPQQVLDLMRPYATVG